MSEFTPKCFPIFPPQGGAVTYYDSSDGYIEKFSNCWADLKKCFLKLEVLQSYQEPGNESLNAYLAGDLELSEELLSKQLAEDEAFQKDIQEKGIRYIRIRPVREPLTAYLKWELAYYLEAAKKGQDIRIIKDTQFIDVLITKYDLKDFMLLDTKHAFILNYRPDGLLAGAWHTGHPPLIEEYQDLFSQLAKSSVPLAGYLAKNK